MREDASSPRSTAGRRGDGLHSSAPRPRLLATAGKINNPFLKTLRGGGGGVSGGGAEAPRWWRLVVAPGDLRTLLIDPMFCRRQNM